MTSGSKIYHDSPYEWARIATTCQVNVGETPTISPNTFSSGVVITASSINDIINAYNSVVPTSSQASSGTPKVYYSYVEDYTFPSINSGDSITAEQCTSIDQAVAQFSTITVSNAVNTKTYCSRVCYDYAAEGGGHGHDADSPRNSRNSGHWYENQHNISYSEGYSTCGPDYTGYYVVSGSYRGSCAPNTCQKKL